METEKAQYIKELQGPLLTNIATAGTKLIETRIHNALLTDVAQRIIPRTEAAYVITAAQMGSSSTYDLNLEDENTMDVRLVAEGATIPIDSPTYGTVQVVPLKYGVAIRISRELVEDAKWNLLDHSIKVAAKRFAENETSLILDQLQGCTQTVTGAATFSIANLSDMMKELEDHDYTPTTLFVGSEVARDLRNLDTFVEADKLGSREMLEKGFIGRIYGLNIIRFSTNATSDTTNFPLRAFITDRSAAYVIVEKRPISIEKFSLPSMDMEAASITQRIAVKRLRDNAIVRIATS